MIKQQNDSAGAFMLSAQTAAMTSQVLLRLIQEHMRMERERELTPGKTTLAKLAAESGGKLDDIKITDKNIGDFKDTARKYNLSYALRRDPVTTPPTYYVFFKQNAGSKDTMESALKEFAQKREKAVLRRKDVRQVEKLPDPSKENHNPERKPQEKSADDPDR